MSIERMIWKPHTDDVETKGTKKLAVLEKLSGTHWAPTPRFWKLYTLGQSDHFWNMGPVPGRQQPRRTPINWTKF